MALDRTGDASKTSKAPREWWDVVTMFNSPANDGHWQKKAIWLPEQWERDPLPTPMPPGMVRRSPQDAWSPDAPPGIITRVQQQAVPICLDCLRQERGSLSALAEALRKQNPADLWRRLPYLTGAFKPSEHKGHRVLAYRIGQVRGSRSSPDMQTLLHALKPGLEGPVERFKVTAQPENEWLHEKLRAFAGGHIDDVDGVERTGRSRRLGQRSDSGAAALESEGGSLGEVLSKAVVKPVMITKGEHLFMVEIESGMNLLSTSLRVLLPGRATSIGKRIPIVPATAADTLRQDLLLHRLSWQVVQVYLGLTAHHHAEWEHARAMLAEHIEDMPFRDAIASLPISDAAKKTIAGDIDLWLYEVCRKASLPTLDRSLGALLARLDSEGYPRLSTSRASEPRAQCERILNIIARELQRVTITHVDWAPLLSLMAPRFTGEKGRRKSKSARS